MIFRVKIFIYGKILRLISLLREFELNYQIHRFKLSRWAKIGDLFKIMHGTSFSIHGNPKSLVIGNNFYARRYCVFMIYDDAKLEIGDNVFFNNYCSINCLGEIVIGDNCLFGEGVKFYDHNHEYSFQDKVLSVEKNKFNVGSIRIGRNCWIDSNVTILKDVVIGDNVIIGANNLIYKSIPSNVIVKAKTDFVIEEKGV